jgi:integrase
MPIKTSLSNSDIEALTSQANNLRDRLIVSFLWDTGVRVSELLKVTIGNIDL